MSPQPAKKGPWFILVRVPNVVEDDDSVISPGTDLGFLLHRPPGTTILNVPRRLAPQGTGDTDYPYVAAVDEYGDFLLLCSSRRSDMSAYLVWLRTHRPEDGEEFVPPNHPGDGGPSVDYFLCDTTAEKASRLPCPDGVTLDPGSVGLIRRGGEMMVVGLQFHANKLLCCSSVTGPWTEKTVTTNSDIRNMMCNDGVFCHGDCLWWVDLSGALYTCDPFQECPLLNYLPLPKKCDLPKDFGQGKCVHFNLHELCKNRCVSVSNDEVRYCQIDQQQRVIEVWRMDPPVGEAWMFSDLADGTDPWTLEYKVPLSDIWSSLKYKEAGLTRSIPVMGLLNPRDPSIVYVIQGLKLLEIDLRSKKMLNCEPIAIADVPEFPSSELLMAWPLPPPKPQGFMDRLRAMALPPVIFGIALSVSFMLLNST